MRIKLGKIFLENGDFDAALGEFARALSVNPSSNEAHALHQLAASWLRTRKSAA